MLCLIAATYYCDLPLQDAKQLKALMYALSSQGDANGGHSGSVSLPQLRKTGDVSEQEVAFVMTDIESSTELSQQDPDAFKQVNSYCHLFHAVHLWCACHHLARVFCTP